MGTAPTQPRPLLVQLPGAGELREMRSDQAELLETREECGFLLTSRMSPTERFP